MWYFSARCWIFNYFTIFLSFLCIFFSFMSAYFFGTLRCILDLERFGTIAWCRIPIFGDDVVKTIGKVSWLRYLVLVRHSTELVWTRTHHIYHQALQTRMQFSLTYDRMRVPRWQFKWSSRVINDAKWLAERLHWNAKKGKRSQTPLQH